MFKTQRLTHTLLPILVFVALYAAIGQVITNSYFQLVLTLVPVWAIFGISWNLLSGTTGLISFGHAAFFGLGCLYGGAWGYSKLRHFALAGHPDRGGGWLRGRVC